MKPGDLNLSKKKYSSVQVFWGEIAPCDHLVQIYDNDKLFLDTLTGFAVCGLLAGESVIVIATEKHLDILNDRLIEQGLDIRRLSEEDRYIVLEAGEMLSRFMVNNWPDEELFEDCISQLITRATKNNRKMSAFGEMVALLWQMGLNGATVRLEHLWNQLLHKKEFTLYCAYPKNGFTQSASDSMTTICKMHSKIIEGQGQHATEIYYRTVK